MVKKDSLKISENYQENTHENKGKEDLNYKKICTRSHMSRICTVITVWYGRVKPYYESMGDLTFHLQLSTLLILNSTAGDSWEFSEHLLHHKSIDQCPYEGKKNYSETGHQDVESGVNFFEEFFKRFFPVK